MPFPSPAAAVILLIDNDPVTLAGLAAVLDAGGHECHCARDAQATVKALELLDLDLIVCNVDFDGQSSPVLYRRLTDAGKQREIPLVFLSSGDPHPLLVEALAGGGAYFLPNPVSAERLLQAVEGALWMPHLVRRRGRMDASVSPGVRPGRWSATRSHLPLASARRAGQPAASRS